MRSFFNATGVWLKRMSDNIANSESSNIIWGFVNID